MKYLELYEGFFDFFNKKKKNQIYLDDIKDCFIDLDMHNVKDDLINVDYLYINMFPYPFRETDYERDGRIFMQSIINNNPNLHGETSLEINDNTLIFHIQFLENTEVERIIIEGCERVKKLFNCKVKIFRRKNINKIENSQKIYEHFVTILIKSKSKIII
jgi:hypothetical protein